MEKVTRAARAAIARDELAPGALLQQTRPSGNDVQSRRLSVGGETATRSGRYKIGTPVGRTGQDCTNFLVSSRCSSNSLGVVADRILAELAAEKDVTEERDGGTTMQQEPLAVEAATGGEDGDGERRDGEQGPGGREQRDGKQREDDGNASREGEADEGARTGGAAAEVETLRGRGRQRRPEPMPALLQVATAGYIVERARRRVRNRAGHYTLDPRVEYSTQRGRPSGRR
ncbi:hypothetical protein F444_09412 [Phytophthora nicotianae P1976]|uniref:Uncharacterized protein n=1 Tax=Phytophthora nicotianae P1976 TaxID=1317066 RepID=A0A081A7R5_PHYNI|nr:hypothetical protein F444_09412 [Phytophthora nicotianae P1976]